MCMNKVLLGHPIYDCFLACLSVASSQSTSSKSTRKPATMSRSPPTRSSPEREPLPSKIYKNYFDDPTLSDLTIRLSDRCVYVHRIVLCRNSEYFNKLILTGFKVSHSIVRLFQCLRCDISKLGLTILTGVQPERDRTPRRRPLGNDAAPAFHLRSALR